MRGEWWVMAGDGLSLAIPSLERHEERMRVFGPPGDMTARRTINGASRPDIRFLFCPSGVKAAVAVVVVVFI